jgi:hypothetical protein
MAARDANDEIIASRRAFARAIVTRRSLRRAILARIDEHPSARDSPPGEQDSGVP